MNEQFERALRLKGIALEKRAEVLREEIHQATVELRKRLEQVESQLDAVAALLTDGVHNKDELVVCGWCGTMLAPGSFQMDGDGNAMCLHDADHDRSPHCRNPNEPWVRGDTVVAATMDGSALEDIIV